MSKYKKNIPATAENEPIIKPQFNIRGIELLHFTVSPQYNLTSKEFQFDVQMNQEMSLKDKIVFSKITLAIKDIQGLLLGNLSLLCTYEVENLNNIVLHKPSATELVIEFNQVTISTARGVIFGLFRGTALHHAILPIVDAKAFKINP